MIPFYKRKIDNFLNITNIILRYTFLFINKYIEQLYANKDCVIWLKIKSSVKNNKNKNILHTINAIKTLLSL